MNKNYMTEVAKLIDLELEETFRIEGDPDHLIYKISDKGVLLYNKEEDFWEELPHMLMLILTGKEKVIKLPWKPTKGERYYEPSLNCPSGLVCFTCWSGNEYDEYRYENGLVFKTHEEALEMAKMLQAVAKKKVFGK